MASFFLHLRDTCVALLWLVLSGTYCMRDHIADSPIRKLSACKAELVDTGQLIDLTSLDNPKSPRHVSLILDYDYGSPFL